MHICACIRRSGRGCVWESQCTGHTDGPDRVRPHARSSRSDLWQWQRMQPTSRVYVYNCTYILWPAADTILLCVSRPLSLCLCGQVNRTTTETIKKNLENRANIYIYIYIIWQSALGYSDPSSRGPTRYNRHSHPASYLPIHSSVTHHMPRMCHVVDDWIIEHF
jgi:hypothetical protein